MKALIVASNAAAAESSAKILRGSRCEAGIAVGADAAIMEMERWDPTAVVVDFHEPSARDHFMRDPASRDVFVARIAGGERRRRFVEQALTEATRPDEEIAAVVASLRAWRQLDAITQQELVAMLDVELRRAPWTKIAGDTPGATVRLAFPAERLEVAFSCFVSSHVLGVLAERLFGGPVGPDEQRDLLFEMVNTAAGAFKRESLADGLVSTIGLPSPSILDDVTNGLARRVAVQRATIQADDLSIHAVVTIGPQPSRMLHAEALREGMVVMHEVRSLQGALLVPARTRLTAVTAERIASSLGTHLVEIAADVT